MLAELGAHVYACEINKDLADYMLWRAARHNMPLTVAPDTDHNMDGTYDMLVCIDTVEHLADPVKFAGRMSELLSPKSTMVLTWTFHQSGDMHPMHLTEEHLNPFLARLHHLGFDRMGQTWPAVFMRT
jgi:2-polyprenyl-3-methyl-5-hydroxy-6-metoxy-1,4-benzoquinol methylase